MTKSSKLLLGILSFLPAILTVVYMVVFFNFFITIFRHAEQDDVLPGLILENMIWIAGMALMLGFLSIGLLIYFIIHAINNKAIDSSERIVWMIVFIFAGMIGFPVYWYMRIWNPKSEGIDKK